MPPRPGQWRCAEAYDWDWAEAEREYRKALALSPGLPAAHLWYGMFLRDQGRLEEALPELRRAAQLEPYSVMTCINLAYGLLWEGNYPAALEQAKRAVELAPDLPTASLILAQAARAAGHTADSDAALERALRCRQRESARALAGGLRAGKIGQA